MKKVSHPHIVKLIGICQDERDLYIITEYVEMGDLFGVLFFTEISLSWCDKLGIALDIAQACCYLHKVGIVHRDIKSQNVLLTDDYCAKLCDFGLAQYTSVMQKQPKQPTSLTRTISFVGTDRWMAPEVLLQLEIDVKADVFSYGALLLELVTNAVPEERSSQDMYQVNHKSFLARVPQDCPPDLAILAIDCTKFSPQKRPDFKEIERRISSIFDQLDEKSD